ncbi:hypothetical protein [Nonomuraea sp. SYSU D8015]|uniref:hypothetical protein n=1 Tax=Nonomuraea sp. SYSU D8015 TaxID=2593644 RepID=UPI00166119F9|nr:hypothetical protein [Nonomuraea sp. SYSU D8015]
MAKYQVTAPCVVHIPINTVAGPALGTFYKDAFLPDDVPQEKIDHLLANKMIVEVEEGGDNEPSSQTPEDVEQASTVQMAEPAAVNSRSSKSDLVAYGVSRGASQAELDDMTREQLLDRYVRGQQPQ